jgi:hypothetical protein
MDSIHPIIPQAPTMPPVAPSPRAQRVNRDGARSGSERERRRRAAGDPNASSADATTEPDLTVPDASGEDGDDPRPRIDITV